MAAQQMVLAVLAPSIPIYMMGCAEGNNRSRCLGTTVRVKKFRVPSGGLSGVSDSSRVWSQCIEWFWGVDSDLYDGLCKRLKDLVTEYRMILGSKAMGYERGFGVFGFFVF